MGLQLEATTREKQAEELREAGQIPAVVYGPHIDAFSVAIPYIQFEKILDQAGESTIIDLNVKGREAVPVLVKDVQREPVKGKILHIDFRHVTMGEEMEVTISLEFVGVALSEKEMGGTLVKSVDSISAKCLPKDLVDQIEVDLSVLKTFEDSISIGDLKVPEGITVLDDALGLVAKVTPPLTEAQLEAMETTATASVEDVEVEGKVEGEGEEGSASAEATADKEAAPATADKGGEAKEEKSK